VRERVCRGAAEPRGAAETTPICSTHRPSSLVNLRPPVQPRLRRMQGGVRTTQFTTVSQTTSVLFGVDGVLDGAGMRRADARPLRHAVECWRRCAPATAASQVHLMCFLSPSRTPAPNNMLKHNTHHRGQMMARARRQPAVTGNDQAYGSRVSKQRSVAALGTGERGASTSGWRGLHVLGAGISRK